MRLQKTSPQSTGGLRFKPLTRVKVDYSIRAYSDSNPGLQVSTFSRDARTPEATKAYRNFKLVTISYSFARTSGTHEEDALHKALRFEPVTFISNSWIRFQRRLDSGVATTNLGICAEIQTLDPSSSRQPHLAHPESNPGLQVPTFSRDARTPETKKKLALSKSTRFEPETGHIRVTV
jgi:hypothetical protein